jgi:hypothetical protein
METYGYLIQNYKDSLFGAYYHVLFLLRRLCIAGSIHLFYDLPYIQVSICSLSCLAVIIMQVFLHMVFIKPIKDKVLNVLMMLIEVCISVCYIASGSLLFSELSKDFIMFLILGSIYSSYFLHSTLGYYKLIKVLYPMIKNYFTRKTYNEVNTKNPLAQDLERI